MAAESKPVKADIAVEVKMLGGLSCKLNGREVILAPKAASLLGYLLYFSETPQTRDLLAGRFWYDCSDSVARKRLSNTLWKIQSESKKVVGHELLATTTALIQVAPNCKVTSDISALRNRQLDNVADQDEYNRNLVESYTGDLLEGYYDDWILAERHRIREDYLVALQNLVEKCKASSRYDQALQYVSKLVADDGLNEAWYREAAKLHAIAGRVPEAVHQYDVCTRIFLKELGVKPSATFTELIDDIKKNVVETPRKAAHKSFIGRQDEKNVLLSAIDTAFQSAGSIVLLEGRRGLGKTALLREVADATQWRGISALTVEHQKTSRLVPFSGLAKMLASQVTGLKGEYVRELVEPIWLQQVASFLPGVAGDGLPDTYIRLEPEEESWRRAEAFTKVILALSDITPLLLTIEDAHWCDSETLTVLEHLIRRVNKKNVVVCLSYDPLVAKQRRDFVDFISSCERMDATTHCQLKPFNEKEVAAYVQTLWFSHPFSQQDIAYLTEQSSGSPTAIKGLIEQMQTHEKRFSATFIEEFFATTISSEPYRDVIASQLRSLNKTTRQVVDFLSVADMALSASELAMGCTLEKRLVLDALSQALAVGLLKEESSGACSLATQQITEVTYQRIAKQQKAVLHFRLVSLCSEFGKPQEVTAYHAAKAGCWLKAYDSHVSAATSALAMHAFPTAVEHFALAQQAAEHLELGDDGRLDELFLVEEAYDAIGERCEQQKVLSRIEVFADSQQDLAKLHLRQALLLAANDKFSEAIDVVEKALAEENPSEIQAKFLSALGSIHLWAGAPARAIDALEGSLAVAIIESGVAEKITLGKSLIETQQAKKGIACLQVALEIARETSNARAQVEALGYLAVGHIAQNTVESAEDAFSEALMISREIAYRHGEGQTLVNMASMYLLYGRAGKAFRRFADAKEVFLSLDSKRGEAFVKANVAELHHVLLGDDQFAQREATEAAIYFRSINDQAHECVCLATLCSIDMRHGRKAFASKRLNEVVRKAKASGDRIVQAYVYRLCSLLEASLRNYKKAFSLLEKAEKCIASASFSPLLPSVLAAKAEMCVALEEKTQAKDLLVQACGLNNATKDASAVTAWRCGMLWEKFDEYDRAKENYRLAFEWLQASISELEDETLMSQAWAVQTHKEIQESYETYFVRSVKVSLPDVLVPNGKKLSPEDFKTIVWHISEPEDIAFALASERRRHRLRRLCAQARQQYGAPRISDLAKALDVSERTIKRDIVALKNKNVTIKTRK